jgi:hypothetical protein
VDKVEKPDDHQLRGGLLRYEAEANRERVADPKQAQDLKLDDEVGRIIADGGIDRRRPEPARVTTHDDLAAGQGRLAAAELAHHNAEQEALRLEGLMNEANQTSLDLSDRLRLTKLKAFVMVEKGLDANAIFLEARKIAITRQVVTDQFNWLTNFSVPEANYKVAEAEIEVLTATRNLLKLKSDRLAADNETAIAAARLDGIKVEYLPTSQVKLWLEQARDLTTVIIQKTESLKLRRTMIDADKNNAAPGLLNA